MTRIRRLTIDDYDEMIDLWERSSLPFKPSGRDSRQEIKRQMNSNPDFFLGAFDGITLIGVVVGSYDGRKGWINRLAVDPEHRRQRIAQLLVARIEKSLMKNGARIICALVEESNLGSISLFEELGYKTPKLRILYFRKAESEDV